MAVTALALYSCLKDAGMIMVCLSLTAQDIGKMHVLCENMQSASPSSKSISPLQPSSQAAISHKWLSCKHVWSSVGPKFLSRLSYGCLTASWRENYSLEGLARRCRDQVTPSFWSIALPLTYRRATCTRGALRMEEPLYC